MKACSEMRRVISALASKHDVDLTAERVILSLYRPGWGLLCISRYWPSLKSSVTEKRVDKRSQRNLLVIENPGSSKLDERNLYRPLRAVAFLTVHGDWIPFEVWLYSQSYQVAELCADGDGFVQVNEVGQADWADWTEKWTCEIEASWGLYGEKVEWLEDGEVVRRVWDDKLHGYSSEVYRPSAVDWVWSK
jgi:hypothetical protein